MPYIDAVYYLGDFKGVEEKTIDDLERTIVKASNTIDVLIGFKFSDGTMDWNTAHDFFKNQIKLATATLVEYYILNGGYDATKQSNIASASVGSFSYTVKGSGEIQEIPNDVYMILQGTGLMYNGIGVIN